MIVGNITPSIIVAGVINADAATTTLLIQAAMIAAGISTLLQLYPVWKFGSRLPVVTGVSFAFVPTLISLATMYGLEGIYGAQIFGGIAAVIFGIFTKRIKKRFPPIVAGTVVLTIGLSLYPVAAGYMAGGIDSASFGSPINWAISFCTLAVVVICNFSKGFAKLAAIFIGIIAGYIVSIPFGLVDITPVREAAWFALPTLMPFKMTFHLDAIVTVVLVFLVASVEMIGDLSAIGGACDRDITDQELSGGIMGMGLASGLSTIFGGLPVATFSQNVGLVLLNKVTSRFVIAIAAGLMLLAGFLPKFAALIATIPLPVLGGATVTVFGMITMSGIQIIIKDELSSRNVTIVGLSIALGLGIVNVGANGALDQLPQWVRIIFGESPVIIATLIAFTLNILVPNKSLKDEEAERQEMDRKTNAQAEISTSTKTSADNS